MSTRTITAVHGTRTWLNHDGATMYEVELTLDGTDSGTVTARSADRWKVGDQVLVKKTNATKYGTHWSLEKPQPNAPQPNRQFLSQGSASGQTAGDRTAHIEASWAIHMAVLLTHNTPSAHVTPSAVHAAALSMLRLKDEIVDDIQQGRTKTTHYTPLAQPEEPTPW